MRFLLVICFISSLAFGQTNSESDQSDFQLCVKKADEFYANKNFTAAHNWYLKAIELNPDNQYVAKKDEECVAIMKVELVAEVESQYQKLLSVANDKYLNCDLPKAKQLYERANGMKPEDEIPIQRLKNINGIFKSYECLKIESDAANNEKNYLIALSKMKAAEKLMPCEKWIKDAIDVLSEKTQNIKVEVKNNVVFKLYKDHTMKDSVMSIEFRVTVNNNSDQKIPDLGVSSRSENLNFYINGEISNPVSLYNGIEVMESEKVISPKKSDDYYVSWVLLPDSGITQAYGNNFTVQWDYCGIKSEVRVVDIAKQTFK